jgi:hypothetical protein
MVKPTESAKSAKPTESAKSAKTDESKKIYDALNRFSTDLLHKVDMRIIAKFNEIYTHDVIIKAVDQFVDNKITKDKSMSNVLMNSSVNIHNNNMAKFNSVYDKILRERFNCNANPTTEEKKKCAIVTRFPSNFTNTDIARELSNSSFCDTTFYNDGPRLSACHDAVRNVRNLDDDGSW